MFSVQGPDSASRKDSRSPSLKHKRRVRQFFTSSQSQGNPLQEFTHLNLSKGGSRQSLRSSAYFSCSLLKLGLWWKVDLNFSLYSGLSTLTIPHFSHSCLSIRSETFPKQSQTLHWDKRVCKILLCLCLRASILKPNCDARGRQIWEAEILFLLCQVPALPIPFLLWCLPPTHTHTSPYSAACWNKAKEELQEGCFPFLGA